MSKNPELGSTRFQRAPQLLNKSVLIEVSL